jgi:hypothetical protein
LKKREAQKEIVRDNFLRTSQYFLRALTNRIKQLASAEKVTSKGRSQSGILSARNSNGSKITFIKSNWRLNLMNKEIREVGLGYRIMDKSIDGSSEKMVHHRFLFSFELKSAQRLE